ncbi:unnamed protein product, partial [Allacma fusca]
MWLPQSVLLIFTGSLLFVQVTTGMVQEPEIVSKFIQNNLVEWKAPEEIIKKYPYYWSGYDFDGRPLWILEFGKWNVRSIAESDKGTLDLFNIYIDQVVYNAFQSISHNLTVETSSEVIAIVDMEGWSTSQVSRANVAYLAKVFNYLVPTLYKYLYHVYIINTNFVAESMINSLRPILGSLMERVEIMGTLKSKWLPRILSQIPQDQLPQ